jgi:indolepyruvate ferredoxin oxidoreductase, beta subunit
VSEIHGMAQRGGVVESAVLMGDVTSPIVSNGEADVLVGFEPVETLRTIGKCSGETVVVTNLQPLPPFTVSIGQGTYPPVEKVMELIRAKVSRVIALNGNDLAQQAGNPLSLNMVMLGALIGSGVVPVSAEGMKETISSSTKKAFLDSNLKAFDLGLEAAG